MKKIKTNITHLGIDHTMNDFYPYEIGGSE